MKTILIPTDFSSRARKALAYAMTLYQGHSCDFYILHAGEFGESASSPYPYGNPTGIKTAIQKQFQALFEELHQSPRNPLHRFIALEEYGNLIDAIRKTVSYKRIDLIVMGTGDAWGLNQFLSGSHTGHVIMQIPCNILVVPEKAAQTTAGKLVFATDFTVFYSHEILMALTEIVELKQCELQVVSVHGRSVILTRTQRRNKAYLEDYLMELFPGSHSFYRMYQKSVPIAISEIARTSGTTGLVMIAKNLNFIWQWVPTKNVKRSDFQTGIPLWVLHEASADRPMT